MPERKANSLPDNHIMRLTTCRVGQIYRTAIASNWLFILHEIKINENLVLEAVLRVPQCADVHLILKYTAVHAHFQYRIVCWMLYGRAVVRHCVMPVHYDACSTIFSENMRWSSKRNKHSERQINIWRQILPYILQKVNTNSKQKQLSSLITEANFQKQSIELHNVNQYMDIAANNIIKKKNKNEWVTIRKIKTHCQLPHGMNDETCMKKLDKNKNRHQQQPTTTNYYYWKEEVEEEDEMKTK